MAQEIEQTGFVLHRRPYRETSLLMTLLTPEHGKLNAVVKGVRSASKTSQSKQAWLQPFQQLHLSWIEKNTQKQPGLVNLRQLEPTQIRFPLQGEANICGLYINELLYRLLYPHVGIESLYKTYQQTLYQLALAKNRAAQSWILRQFEYEVLMTLGVGFTAEFDAYQNPIQADKCYHFFAEVGSVPAELVSVNDQNQGIAISGYCLLQFAHQQFDDTCLSQWKILFRQLLAGYLGEAPIQSRTLFKEFS